jgi:endonuclease/exonuclease/phosphatase family metal-dependent hydrolase
LLAELHQRQVDVIALQEVTQELLDMILSVPWIRRSYQVSEPEVIGYDVIILSRLPIRRMATVRLPSTMGRRLIVAELACGLEVATVHLESTPAATAVRLEQLAIVFDYLASRGDVVLVGDMNFDPTASLETGAIDPRFVDLWPALRPSDPGHTIDASRNPMRGMSSNESQPQRVDRAFARVTRWIPHRIDLLGTSAIDDEQTFISDHFGLGVDLAQQPETTA